MAFEKHRKTNWNFEVSIILEELVTHFAYNESTAGSRPQGTC